MTYLRYLIFLFASSMVVKIPLMALFHWLYLLITGDLWIGSADTALDKIIRSEVVFFIPLYLIYLPLFIYNIKTRRTDPRFMYWDMAMICLIICPVAFAITLGTNLWLAVGAVAFITAYLILTVTLHLIFCRPYMTEAEGHPLHPVDKTLPEYAQWQAQVEKSQKERQEKFETKHCAKLQETAEKKIRNKIEYIFFYTGLFATILSATIVISLFFLAESAHTCYIFSYTATECFQSWSWILKPSTVDIVIFFFLIFLFLSGLYVAIIYALYGTVIKRLWYGNMRTYAHFGLAANIPILAYLLAILGTTNEVFPHDLRVISFYLFSYTALLASALHLNFLKRYDKAFGIPEEPPRTQRWYDKLFGRQTAEV